MGGGETSDHDGGGAAKAVAAPHLQQVGTVMLVEETGGGDGDDGDGGDVVWGQLSECW